MIGTAYVHLMRANVRLRGCSDPFPAGMRCPYHTFPIEGPLLSLPCPASLGSTLARMAAANPTTPSSLNFTTPRTSPDHRRRQ